MDDKRTPIRFGMDERIWYGNTIGVTSGGLSNAHVLIFCSSQTVLTAKMHVKADCGLSTPKNLTRVAAARRLSTNQT